VTAFYLKPNVGPSTVNFPGNDVDDIDNGIIDGTPDGVTMDSTANAWSTTTSSIGLTSTPLNGTIDSVRLRVRAGVGGDASPDDTISYTFTITGTNAPTLTNTPTWTDADSAASPNLVTKTSDLQTSVSASPSDISGWQILITNAYSQNMGKDGMFLAIDEIELEVNMTLGSVSGSGTATYLFEQYLGDDRVQNNFGGVLPLIHLNSSASKSGADLLTTASADLDGTGITFDDPSGGQTGQLFLGVENPAATEIDWTAVLVDPFAFGEERQAVGSTTTAASSVPALLDYTPLSGNLLVAHLANTSSSSFCTGVTGFTLIDTTILGDYDIQLAYKISDGTESLIVGNFDAPGNGGITVVEYQGPFDASPLDQIGENTAASSTSVTVTSGSPQAAANNLAVAVGLTSNSVEFSFDNGFVGSTGASVAPQNGWQRTGSLVLSSTAAASTTLSGALGSWVAQIATFKQSSTGETASGTPAIPAVTASGTAERIITASSTASIPAITASGTAEVIKTATGAATIAAITASGTAERIITASSTASIPAITASGTTERIITASSTASIPAITASGTAKVTKHASGAATIPAITASGVAKVIKTAAAAVTIAAITASGVAEVVNTASGAVTVPAITASGTAERIITASGTPSISAVTASGTADVTGTVTASGTPTIPAVTASGTAEYVREATGAATIAAITASGTAEYVREATGAATIAAITASGNATVGATKSASGNPSIPAITASGTAERIITASGTPAIPAVTASGTAEYVREATGAATIAAITASGTAERIITASGTPSIPPSRLSLPVVLPSG
jgi:hypothetical protein